MAPRIRLSKCGTDGDFSDFHDTLTAPQHPLTLIQKMRGVARNPDAPHCLLARRASENHCFDPKQ